MIKTERNVARRATGGLSLAAVALLTAACLPISTAKAATITETYDFTATGSAGSPVNPWMGSFTITFNPTASGNFLFALDAFSSNLPAIYNPFVASQKNNFIVIGDDCSSGGNCDAGPNKAFFDFFADSSGNPTANAVAINNGFGSNLSVTLASTPLPAALPLFATGLGAMGLFGWRRKRKNAIAA